MDPATADGVRKRLPSAVLVIGFAALALVRATRPEETDPYWQIRAGMENLRGHPLSRPDQWSWAPVGGDFRQTSPLWNTVLGWAWDTASWPGMALVGLVSVGCFLGAVTLLSLRLGARPLPILLGGTPVLLLALPLLSPRASLAATTLALTSILLAPRAARLAVRGTAGAAATLFGATALSSTGIWLHQSWLALGPLCALTWSVACWWSPGPRWRRVLTAVSGGVGTSLGLMAGPYGLGVVAYSRQVAEACSGLLLEWISPFSPGTAPRWAVPAVAALVLAALATRHLVRQLGRGRRTEREVVLAGLVLLAVPGALVGVTAIRFTGLALLALVPVAAMAATHVADRISQRSVEEPPRGVMRSPRVRFWSDGARWPTLVALVLVLLVPIALLSSTRLARPVDVLATADALPATCLLFAEPSTASAVLLVRPDVRVWTDGRADYWGRQRNLEARATLSRPEAASAVLASATCAALPPDSPAASALEGVAEWSEVATSRQLTVWVRAAP